MDANATGATNLDIGNDQVIPEDINISDVIEVIETDMFNGGGEIPGTSSGQPTPSGVQLQKPYVKIIEQPASKALRFRYECEGRSAGSIPGASSTPENKTYPTIKIFGYTGRAVVVVSCVTKDAPYRPHPHSLVGREGCKKGVCTMEVPPETMTVVFSNLGIQCVKKKDIEQALRTREQIRVDPFQTKFLHKNQPTSIDLNAVRLCFQVFLEGAPKKYTVPLQPIVSDIIYDKKAMSDLVIVKLSHCTCPVDGGRDDFILLCEKVAKEDIQIRFYEERDGQLVWEGFGDFQPSQVHKQTGIWYRPPRYKTLEVTEPVRVFIQLRRPSDGAASEPLPFEYLPLDSDHTNPKRKKIDYDPSRVLRRLSEQARLPQQQQQQQQQQQPQFNLLQMNIPMDVIKSEPRDTTSPPYQTYAPVYPPMPSISPQYNIPFEGLQQNPLGDLTFNNTVPTTSTNMFPQQQIDWRPVATAAAGTSAAPAGTEDCAAGISNLLNLDNHQLVSSTINSKEYDTYLNLSESFSNVSLSVVAGQENASDCLTQLANTTMDNMFRMSDK